MKKHIISYITNSGIIMLNAIFYAVTRQEAIDDLKGDEGVQQVLPKGYALR